MHFCPDADHPFFIQVPQGVVGHVGDLPGDLFRTQLGIPGLTLILGDMNGGINVITDQSLVEEDGVFVVVALPHHETDQDISAQGHLPLVGRGSVRDDVTGPDPVSGTDQGPLVDTGPLVGPVIFSQMIMNQAVVISSYPDAVTAYVLNQTVLIDHDADP